MKRNTDQNPKSVEEAIQNRIDDFFDAYSSNDASSILVRMNEVAAGNGTEVTEIEKDNFCFFIRKAQKLFVALECIANPFA